MTTQHSEQRAAAADEQSPLDVPANLEEEEEYDEEDEEFDEEDEDDDAESEDADPNENLAVE